MVVRQFRGGYHVKDVLTIHSPSGPITETDEWDALEKKSGFFDVEMAGTKVGWGFCDKTTCQVQAEGSKPGERRGEIINVGTFSISRTGWGEDGGNHMTWKGSVRKK